MNTRRIYQPFPEDDFRGMPGWYCRDLGTEAMLLGSLLIVLAVPAVLAPLLTRPVGWLLLPFGLLLGWGGVRSLQFAVKALEAGEGR